MNEQKLRMIINIGTVIATLVLVALIIGLVFQFVNRGILQSNQNKLQNELDNLSKQVEYYENANTYINENIEDYARENYGYGKNGEKKYTFQWFVQLRIHNILEIKNSKCLQKIPYSQQNKRLNCKN